MNPLRIIETFNLIVGKLFSFFVFIGMAIVVYEVIARYVFNAPSVRAHSRRFGFRTGQSMVQEQERNRRAAQCSLIISKMGAQLVIVCTISYS